MPTENVLITILETHPHLRLEPEASTGFNVSKGDCRPKYGYEHRNLLLSASPVKNPDSFRDTLRKLDTRQWWLWTSTVLVLILLTLTVASFAFPALISREDSFYSFYMNQAVRSLVGVVLVFSVYVVYQQTQIIRMRNQLADQVASLTKVETLTNEVYKLAALDSLTGVYNRRSGEQRLSEEISRAERHHRPLTLLMLDLDGLKKINDEFGHGAGDAALRTAAERLQRAIRGSDQAVRLGGDEFMAILPECKPDEVRHVLMRLEDLEFIYEGLSIPCRFSRGWADYRLGETPQQLIDRADAALYADKRTKTASIPPMGSSRPQAQTVGPC